MKKLILLAITALFLAFTNLPEGSFCEGFSDGLRDGAQQCFIIASPELCPIEPLNSDGYKTGYGLGFAHAYNKYCEK